MQLFLCCISSVINNRKQEQRKIVFHQQGNVKRTIDIKEKRKYSICDFFINTKKSKQFCEKSCYSKRKKKKNQDHGNVK